MANEADAALIEIPLNEVFIKAREAKGLSLETVSSRLNMSVAQLEKLESNHFNPADLTTFERGYVRNYAALLELDPDLFDIYFPESTSVYSELHSVQRYSTPVNKPLIGRGFFQKLLGLGVIILIAFLLWTNLPDLVGENGGSTITSIDMPLEKPVELLEEITN